MISSLQAITNNTYTLLYAWPKAVFRKILGTIPDNGILFFMIKIKPLPMEFGDSPVFVTPLQAVKFSALKLLILS